MMYSFHIKKKLLKILKEFAVNSFSKLDLILFALALFLNPI